MENIFSTRSSKTLIEISKIVQFKKLFESQLNLKLFSRQYLLKASLINCISTLLWIINLHFIRKHLKITFNNYSKHGSTFNIYPILRAPCVKIAYVFSSMGISSRDSQVQKRWRLVGTPSAHLSRPRFENKTNCLVSSLFSRSSFPLFLSLFLLSFLFLRGHLQLLHVCIIRVMHREKAERRDRISSASLLALSIDIALIHFHSVLALAKGEARG